MRIQACCVVAFVFLCLHTGLGRAQEFEKPFVNGTPAQWYAGSSHGGSDYRGVLDTMIFHSGKNSIRLESTAMPQPREFGVARTAIYSDSIRGKTVQISAWVRTKEVGSYASIWANDGVGFSNAIVPGGTHDWQHYSFELKIAPNAQYVTFGGVLDGEGTAWFDDFEVHINGKDYEGDSGGIPMIQSNSERLEKSLRNGVSLAWYTGGSGLDASDTLGASLDSTVVRSGKCSMRLESKRSPQEIRNVTSFISIKSEAGKTAHVSAWVRTDNVARYANFYGTASTMAGQSSASHVLIHHGSQDWHPVAFDLKLDSNSEYVVFGCVLYGTGTLWLDDVDVQVDGKDYVPDTSALQAIGYSEGPKITLTDDQLSWLVTNVSPLTTTDPTASLSDLEPLKQIVGNADIVGLGEVTHGTHENFLLKHRIVEYLAEHMGFTIFAIEANMPEAYNLNQYVLHGTGDPETLLAGLYFWTWNTEEVLDMVKWMRAFNASGKGRIQFLGFDMQEMQVAAKNVEDFINAHDNSISRSVQTTYAFARELKLKVESEYSTQYGFSRMDFDTTSWSLAIDDCRGIEKHLRSYPASFLQTVNSDSLAWALQNAVIVTEAMESIYGYQTGDFVRDSCMAYNIKWIRDHNPGAKIILWAHDGHIAKDSGRMGYYVRRLYGPKYVNIGFSFYDGTYTAIGSSGLNSYTAPDPTPGSIEYGFHRLKRPLWLLDLRKSNAEDSASRWLREPVRFREIGGAEEKKYRGDATQLTQSFDALIYIDHGTASHLLQRSAN